MFDKATKTDARDFLKSFQESLGSTLPTADSMEHLIRQTVQESDTCHMPRPLSSLLASYANWNHIRSRLSIEGGGEHRRNSISRGD
jgi:hypothetical protein